MRSKASYDGHPIHPALIPFPFAFLTGALLFDLLGAALEIPSWWTTGGHLAAAGIVTALIAAVPGFIDYVYTVPPRSSGKQRARRHMILNLSAVGLVTVAWLVRQVEAPPALVVVLELVAVGLLVMGGWMGGVLVSRNQIGVDHRYAAAGKWKEATLTANGGSVVVSDADSLKVDQMMLLHVGRQRIVLARDGDGFVAFDDRCPHRGGSLAGGTLICGTVQCPWHGSQFDVRSGMPKAGPARASIDTYTVAKEKGAVRVHLDR